MNLLNILAQIAFTWIGAMGWHLWRIAIGRPAYRWITDTGISDLSFLLVFFIASALRWSVVHGSDWLVFLASTIATLFVLGSFTLRSNPAATHFSAQSWAPIRWSLSREQPPQCSASRNPLWDCTQPPCSSWPLRSPCMQYAYCNFSAKPLKSARTATGAGPPCVPTFDTSRATASI
ncbi:hypothetical protein [Polaromonas sp. AER18D-145]|uniref:hypothetical protein n=1 Tax=Polaromonas sp. AER18D-145 TaxID=1977060 RepID=UPI000BBB8D0E|nr:hypothetical protein [Polaromonas sp. AER18D-145]